MVLSLLLLIPDSVYFSNFSLKVNLSFILIKDSSNNSLSLYNGRV